MAKEWRGEVRAVYFSIEGKNIWTKQRKWGSMSLKEEKKRLEMTAKVKVVLEQPEKKIVFMTNFD